MPRAARLGPSRSEYLRRRLAEPAASTAGWCGSQPSPAWKPAIQPGQARICGAAFGRPPLLSVPAECLTPAIEDWAVQILTLLADRGSIVLLRYRI
jgi:hypothetical protein